MLLWNSCGRMPLGASWWSTQRRNCLATPAALPGINMLEWSKHTSVAKYTGIITYTLKTYSLDTCKERQIHKHLPFSLAWVAGTRNQPIKQNKFGEHTEAANSFHSQALDFVSTYFFISHYVVLRSILVQKVDYCIVHCVLCSVGCVFIYAGDLYLPTDCMMSRSSGAARSGLRWVNIERTTTANARVSSSYSSNTAPQSRHLFIWRHTHKGSRF